MHTNFDRLRETVSMAYQVWRSEQAFCRPNATNESAWSVQIVEPILAALQWPRLNRQELGGSGAFFEWPGKHQVDVALLENGGPKAFLELKQTHAGCREDLGRKLTRHPELRTATYAVAAWFLDSAGFAIYRIGSNAAVSNCSTIYLADAARDPSELASLAAPALQNSGRDPGAWLAQPCEDVNPVRERMRPRDVQDQFFTLLRQRLNVAVPIETRRSFSRHEPPTPTFAFAELPGVLPQGWGIVLDIDPTMNKVNCFFYRRSSRKAEEVGRSFDGGHLDEATLTSFLENDVMPVIEQWRREAAVDGFA